MAGYLTLAVMQYPATIILLLSWGPLARIRYGKVTEVEKKNNCVVLCISLKCTRRGEARNSTCFWTIIMHNLQSFMGEGGGGDLQRSPSCMGGMAGA